jgi:hypothetical protein
MELSGFVTRLHNELDRITQVAGGEAAQAAGLLVRALDPSVRLTLLEVLSAAAAEITDRLGDTVVEVRLSGGEPSFVVQTAPPPTEPAGPPPAEEEDDAGTARVTLRLPEGLKARIEETAARERISVNTWLARAARQALDRPATGVFSWRGPGQRITGFYRS